ncbi:hypothetical protein M231_07668 [Tremella mesenterica]|uniref:Required for respiratory growth protein 9, mitochondrial n=2 Tax=Tremella mesenterica TaxID=5217 RepID=A0A4Q1BFH1_TREME|nr:hypothetical protein M231_07668 [Tremella mesenterica]
MLRPNTTLIPHSLPSHMSIIIPTRQFSSSSHRSKGGLRPKTSNALTQLVQRLPRPRQRPFGRSDQSPSTSRFTELLNDHLSPSPSSFSNRPNTSNVSTPHIHPRVDHTSDTPRQLASSSTTFTHPPVNSSRTPSSSSSWSKSFSQRPADISSGNVSRPTSKFVKPPIQARPLYVETDTDANLSNSDDPPRPWKPTKKLTYAAMASLKALHLVDPDRFTRGNLSELFGVSEEAVKRICKSKFRDKAVKEMILRHGLGGAEGIVKDGMGVGGIYEQGEEREVLVDSPEDGDGWVDGLSVKSVQGSLGGMGGVSDKHHRNKDGKVSVNRGKGEREKIGGSVSGKKRASVMGQIFQGRETSLVGTKWDTDPTTAEGMSAVPAIVRLYKLAEEAKKRVGRAGR